MRVVARIEPEREFEVEGVKFTMRRPSPSDSVALVVSGDQSKMYDIIVSKIIKFEGLVYEDGKPVKSVSDIPSDLIWPLIREYSGWYTEIAEKNRIAMSNGVQGS